MKCQFSENEYSYMISEELRDNKDSFFLPTQVLEKKVGFDLATYCKKEKIEKMPNRNGKKDVDGVEITPNLWNPNVDYFDSEDFKSFKYNLFLQFKIPEYMNSTIAKEYKHWNRDYFRYAIYEEQLQTLIQLEKNVQSNAIVTYACPAFWKRLQLRNSFKSGTLIDESNYVLPSTLKGHKVYTYITRGVGGVAFSEPVVIEGINLRSALKEISQNFKFESNVDFISETYNQIITTINSLESIHQQMVTSVIERNLKKYNGYEVPSFRKFLTIYSFTSFYGIEWLIGV